MTGAQADQADITPAAGRDKPIEGESLLVTRAPRETDTRRQGPRSGLLLLLGLIACAALWAAPILVFYLQRLLHSPAP